MRAISLEERAFASHAGWMRRLPAILLVACAHAAPIGSRPGFAVSKASAAEVCLPEGELEYLRIAPLLLRRRARFHRVGSVGSRNPAEANDPRLLQQMDISGVLPPGDPDLHIIDAYELRCGDEDLHRSTSTCTTARGAQEQPAPDGFTRSATGNRRGRRRDVLFAGAAQTEPSAARPTIWIRSPSRQPLAASVWRKSIAFDRVARPVVGPVGRHRVEDVGELEDLRGTGNALPRSPSG